MTEAARTKQREYRAKWRAANREHIRAYDQHWNQEHPENRRETNRKYYERKRKVKDNAEN